MSLFGSSNKNGSIIFLLIQNIIEQDLISRECSAWKDFGLLNKIWAPSPSKIGLSVVFKVGIN